MTDFTDLYSYNTSYGIVVPDYDEVRGKVVQAFQEVFGGDIDTTEQTAVGRLIEAVSILARTVLQVNAQNANNFNPRFAIGAYLDNIGALFGLSRFTGESDTSFRARILSSQSTGKGFVESIRSAVSAVSGVTSAVVLENGYNVTSYQNGVVLDPHSVYVCVAGGTDVDVAEAIYGSKSAGCGYTDISEGAGTQVEESVTDSTSGQSTNVIFYRPVSKTVNFTYTVSGPRYTGSDLIGDAETLVNEALEESTSASALTSADIISYVAASGLGIVLKSLTFTVGAVSGMSEVPHAAYENLVAGTHTVTVV